MKTTTIAATMTALLMLASCGDDKSPGASSASQQNTTDEKAATHDGDEQGSFTLRTAAKQILSSLGNGGSYEIDGATLTFLFKSGSTQANGVSACQISQTVIDAVAPDEVERVIVTYSDGSLDCKEELS